MIDLDQLAIADVLRHKTLGIVSYQPENAFNVPTGTTIYVRDIEFSLHKVNISDCFDDISGKEMRHYWAVVHDKEGL